MGEQVKAGPELDALVAEKVFGWPVMRSFKPGEFYSDARALAKKHSVDRIVSFDEASNYCHLWFPFHEHQPPSRMMYSTNAEDAWQVVEAMRAKGYEVDIDDWTELGAWAVRFRVKGGDDSFDGGWRSGAGAALPLAVCLAALAALEVRHGE